MSPDQHDIPSGGGAGLSPEEVISQRSHERFAYNGNIEVSWILNDIPQPPVMLHGLNVSRSGIGLKSRGMVHAGTIGAVLLSVGKTPSIRGIEVVFCQYQGHMEHLIGARWAKLAPQLRFSIDQTEQGPRLRNERWR
ncbi:MAG: hypothetical protein HND57_01110 [Planctomycetes bacterium]|nr:hypothetical protein [Planctomycetota bacterium]